MAITTLPGATATDLTTLTGTDGADVFSPTTAEADKIVISALKGNDLITFSDSVTNSDIRAGRDGDTVTFVKSLEKSNVSGDKGNDTITVTQDTFSSTVSGGENIDTLTFSREVSDSFLYGGTSNDTITLSALVSKTFINGNRDEDTFTITGTLKESSVYGGKGNDVYTAGTVTESLLSGDKSNDDYTITGVVTDSTISGGTGNDTVELTAAVTTSSSSVTGGDGDDSVDWKGTTGGGLYIDGGAGDDNLEADGNLKDTVIGGLGADTIDIVAGAAVIWGGSSQFDSNDKADSIVATDGAVTIYGAAGNDTITVGTGKSVVNGGADNDDVTAGAGDHSISGGSGNDTVTMDDAALTKLDTVTGDNGTDILEITTIGAAIADEDFTAISSFEELQVTGAAAAGHTITFATKFAATGISTITGKQTTQPVTFDASALTTAITVTATDENVNDTIKGGTGNDTINTGLRGAVNVTGGKGLDQFNVTSAEAVTITDFNTNSQADTFNLTSTAGTVGITVKSDFTATTSHINNSGGTVTLTPDGAGTDINLANVAGDTGFTIAAGTSTGGTKALLTGSKNNDSITSSSSGATITGGKGADALVGAAGVDTIKASVGDAPAATATNISANALAASATVTFGGGVDVLTIFATGTDKIDLSTAGATTIARLGAINALTIGANYIIRGGYAGGTFTENSVGGADYLLFTAAGTTLNGSASSFGTNAIIADGFSVTGTDVI